MANQGNRNNPGQGNQSRQGDRDRESNLGQPGSEKINPTGTSGWQGDSKSDRDRDDEEDSGLGNRTTNR